jgi:hypothetical protein
MKLIDIVQKIDKSQGNESYVDVTDFNCELDLNLDYTKQDRLKAYFIGNWLCTDSWVGFRMYFLDDEPVAVSSQMGRKSDEEFKWFSKNVALKVRDYLLSLVKENNDDLNLTICDLNDEYGDCYTVEFKGNI